MTGQPVSLEELREAAAIIRRVHLWMWDIPDLRGREPERELRQASNTVDQHIRDLALPPVTYKPRTGVGPRV